MQKTTTVLVLLALVAVTSAAICCTPEVENTGKVEKASDSRAARAPPVTATVQKSKMKAKPLPKIPKTQVLILKDADKMDESLIAEWKSGKSLDWNFISNDCGVKKDFPIHQSVVLKYSPYISTIHEAMSQRGIDRNRSTLYYPAKIVASLVTLMYEHKITINKSDYNKLMAAAKSIQIDSLIVALETKDASALGKK